MPVRTSRRKGEPLWLRPDVHSAVSESLTRMLRYIHVNDIPRLQRKIASSEIDCCFTENDLKLPRRLAKRHIASIREVSEFPVLRGLSSFQQSKQVTTNLLKRRLLAWRNRVDNEFYSHFAGNTVPTRESQTQISNNTMDALRDVFTYYCSQSGPLHFNGLELAQFIELLNDSTVFTNSKVTIPMARNMFLKYCFDMSSDKFSALDPMDSFCLPQLLSFDWFVVTLETIAQLCAQSNHFDSISVSDAFEQFVSNFVLPNAQRRKLDALSMTLSHIAVLPSILIAEHVLEKLFQMYSGSQISDGAMDLQELTQFCRDFDICPRVPYNVIEFNFKELLPNVPNSISNADDDDELRFPEFLEMVGRIAVILFPPESSDVLRKLVGKYRTDFMPPVGGTSRPKSSSQKACENGNVSCALPILLCDTQLQSKFGSPETQHQTCSEHDVGDNQIPSQPEMARRKPDNYTENRNGTKISCELIATGCDGVVHESRKAELESIACTAAQRIMELRHPWSGATSSVNRKPDGSLVVNKRPRTRERLLRLPGGNQQMRRAPHPGWRPRRRSSAEKAKRFGNRVVHMKLQQRVPRTPSSYVPIPVSYSHNFFPSRGNQQRQDETASRGSKRAPNVQVWKARSGDSLRTISKRSNSSCNSQTDLPAQLFSNTFRSTSSIQLQQQQTSVLSRGDTAVASLPHEIPAGPDSTDCFYNQNRIDQVARSEVKSTVPNGSIRLQTGNNPMLLWDPPQTPDAFNGGVSDLLSPTIASRLEHENQTRLWFAEIPPPRLPDRDMVFRGDQQPLQHLETRNYKEAVSYKNY